MIKPWKWESIGLSSNSAITSSFIKEHWNKPWNWSTHGLSSNLSISQEFINENLDKP